MAMILDWSGDNQDGSGLDHDLARALTPSTAGAPIWFTQPAQCTLGGGRTEWACHPINGPERGSIMRLTSGREGEVRSDVIDLTDVPLQTLQQKKASPVLTDLLKRRYLAPQIGISAFQSYIDEEPDTRP